MIHSTHRISTRFAKAQDNAAPLPNSFTLVELLVVMAIIGILATIATPVISSIMRSQTMNQSVAKLNGVLDIARSEAMDKNSYVWVAFSTNSASNPMDGIWAATITSADGTEAMVSNGTWVTSTNIPSGSIQLLTRMENLSGVRINASPSTGANYSALITSSGNTNAAMVNTLQTNLTWTVTPAGFTEAKVTTFTQAIEFTPSGEARGSASSTWYNNIQLGLEPAVGNTTNCALFNVGRSSGKVTVYR